ncbi:hypothetical protein HAV15_004406 [Penicillium sp. str. |nr:hypothetical protein HAV15_004406 [Penicillium sp. str. \
MNWAHARTLQFKALLKSHLLTSYFNPLTPWSTFVFAVPLFEMSASMASAVTFLIAAKNVLLGVLEAIIVAKEILDKVKEAAEDAEDVATVRILCHLAVSPKLNRSPRGSPSSVLLAKVSRFTERAMITNLTSWSQTSEDTPSPIQALANTGPEPVTQLRICVYGGSDTAPSSVMFSNSMGFTKRSVP